MSNTTQLQTVIKLAATLGACGVKAAKDTNILQRAADFIPVIGEIPDLLTLNAAEVKKEWAGLDDAGKAALAEEVAKDLGTDGAALAPKVEGYLEAGVDIAQGIAKAAQTWSAA
jgi:hypothetical protein